MLIASLYLKDLRLILSKNIKILYFNKKNKLKIIYIYSTLYVIKHNAFFKVKKHLLKCIPISI